MSIQEEIRSLARRLRLPAIADYQEIFTDDPGPRFAEGLLQLLQAEVAGREERGFARRLKAARLPYFKTLDMYERRLLPHLSDVQIDELATCDFIRHKHNVLAVGNSGTGMIMPLLDELIEARDNRELSHQMRTLEGYDLLILDEFGYQTLTQAQASMLFQVFAIRHERKSTYVTTNHEFSRWVDVTGNLMLTSALVDRFAHKSILLNMNGPSYRLKEGRQANKNKNTKEQ
jgi:DNA replication protein DnaC